MYLKNNIATSEMRFLVAKHIAIKDMDTSHYDI